VNRRTGKNINTDSKKHGYSQGKVFQPFLLSYHVVLDAGRVEMVKSVMDFFSFHHTLPLISRTRVFVLMITGQSNAVRKHQLHCIAISFPPVYKL